MANLLLVTKVDRCDLCGVEKPVEAFVYNSYFSERYGDCDVTTCAGGCDTEYDVMSIATSNLALICLVTPEATNE